MSSQAGEKLVRLLSFRRHNRVATDHGELTCKQSMTEGSSRLQVLLHESLDFHELMKRFSREVRKCVVCDGLEYKNVSAALYYIDGVVARHQCVYEIRHYEKNLGTLKFSRQKIFEEQELEEIERLIAGLGQPLCNSVKYEQAISTSQPDALTGLRKCGYYFDVMPHEMLRIKRYHTAYSLMLIDVDDFNKINDEYGRKAGDEVLKQVARKCREGARDCDIVLRSGSDRFLILLPQTTTAEAKLAAQRLKALCSESVIINEKEIDFSLSVGIVTATEGESSNELIRRVDHALCRAKQTGKNCIVLSSYTSITANSIFTAVNNHNHVESEVL